MQSPCPSPGTHSTLKSEAPDYAKVAFARPGWRDVLERWHVDAIVADTKTWTSVAELRKDPAWRVAYEDKDGVLFVRA